LFFEETFININKVYYFIHSSNGFVHMIEDLISALLKKFKKEKEDSPPEESTPDSDVDSTSTPATKEDVVEYREVLYSDKPNPVYHKKSPSRKFLFTDVDSVESDIDDINRKREAENGNVEKRVDMILTKKKQKIKKPMSRKPANVVYVVSKPQPGQVKGDWAVRTHRKIFSHHRTKQAAIKKARNIALDRDATVLIQNTNGTFSDGFKPRKKNNNTK
jgi:hypothetical protein